MLSSPFIQHPFLYNNIICSSFRLLVLLQLFLPILLHVLIPLFSSSLIVRWVVGSIPHGEPTEFHDWCNKEDRGMCYHVCGMVYIKEPLLLIGKRSRCTGGSGSPPLPTPLSLSLSLDILVILYHYIRRHITVNKMY